MDDDRHFGLRLLWNERYPGDGRQDDGADPAPDCEPRDER